MAGESSLLCDDAVPDLLEGEVDLVGADDEIVSSQFRANSVLDANHSLGPVIGASGRGIWDW